jgi:Integrase zinc binding domain
MHVDRRIEEKKSKSLKKMIRSQHNQSTVAVQFKMESQSKVVQIIHKVTTPVMKSLNIMGLSDTKGRVCIGSKGELRQRLMRELHDSTVGGHSGITTTYHRVKKMFHWPNLKEDVNHFIERCHNCQINKPEYIPSPGLLQPLPIPEEAWTSIGMDFISGLPKSEGKEVVMVVIDSLTKYGHFIPLAHPYKAVTVAQAFMDNVYKLYGLPLNIISDRDPIFTSVFWRELMKRIGVKLNMSTAYHPKLMAKQKN